MSKIMETCPRMRIPGSCVLTEKLNKSLVKENLSVKTHMGQKKTAIK